MFKDLWNKLYSVPVIAFLGIDLGNILISFQILIAILTIIKLSYDLKKEKKR